MLSGIVGVSVMSLSSCKKDSNNNNNTNTTQTKTEILISGTGKWYISSWKEKESGQATIEYIDRSKACTKDDGYTFTATSNTATIGDFFTINPVTCTTGEDPDGDKDGFGWFFKSDGVTFNWSGLDYVMQKWTKDEIRLYKAIEDTINGDSSRLWFVFNPIK